MRLGAAAAWRSQKGSREDARGALRLSSRQLLYASANAPIICPSRFSPAPGTKTLTNHEAERPPAGRSTAGRKREQPELIAPVVEARACGTASGQTQRIASGKQVTQSREVAEAFAVRVPQLHVKTSNRADARALRRADHASYTQEENRGLGVGRFEAALRKVRRADEVALRCSEDERPRHV